MTVGAAASLAGSPGPARAVLAELTRGHLLTEHRPGRYAFHDLLRAYAAELALDRDDDAGRRAAVGRMLDHFLHAACVAATLIDPFFAPESRHRRPGPSSARPPPPRRRCLVRGRACHLAGRGPAGRRTGLAARAWQLAWALSTFLLRRGFWNDQALACEAGLDAARAVGDPAGEAHALLLLALGYARSGRGEAAPRSARPCGCSRRSTAPPQPGDRVRQADLARRQQGATATCSATPCGPWRCPGWPATGPWRS